MYPPAIITNKFNLDGEDYLVIILFIEDYTFAHVLLDTRGGGKIWTAGLAKRHYKDKPNRRIGMRVAMRKACGIGNPFANYKYPALYSAFRKEYPLEDV